MSREDGSFNVLIEAIKDKLGSRIVFNAVPKDKVVAVLKDQIAMHDQIVKSLSVRSDIEMKNWLRECVQPNLSSCTGFSAVAYDNYSGSLKNKAKAAERSRPLGALLATCADMHEVMTKILKQVDQLFDQKEVTIYDCRVSQIAVLAFIRESNLLAEFAIYLFAAMTRIANGDANSIPRYRDKFLSDHMEKAVHICNDIINKEGRYNILEKIDRLKKNGEDLLLGLNGKFLAGQMLPRNFVLANFFDALGSGLSALLSLFTAPMDVFDSWQIDRYKRNKEIKEWLENHNALLKLELEQTNKSSPEYTKLVNIIKAYDEKIAELDESIQNFEKD